MQFKNLALGTVLTAPSPDTSGTSLVLNSGEGARFPDPATTGDFYATAFPPGENPHLGNAEIVKVTARSTDTFTIVRAQRSTTAKSIAVDWIVIQGIYAEDIVASNSFIFNETPSGTVNGSNTAFDTASAYVAGAILVYRDGQLMKGGGADYTETDSNTITFVTAPVTGSVLLVTYQSAVTATGNADTLDGQHAPSGTIVGTSDTQTLTNKTLTSPVINAPTGDVATITGTQTLTNKTLTSPKINENVALTTTATELNLLNGKLGAWTTSSPTVTAASGSFTSVACAMRHTQIGKIVFIEFTITITTNGTAASATLVPLPVNCAAVTVLPGRETAAIGKMLQGYVGATSITVLGYDNLYVGANGYILVMGGSYEAA